jgi:hypothetical protein
LERNAFARQSMKAEYEAAQKLVRSIDEAETFARKAVSP